MNGPSGNDNLRHADPGDDRIAAMLDTLGEHDRGAPGGLEERVMASVAGVLAPQPIAIRDGQGAWWQRTPVRLAAGLAIAATAGLLLYSAASKQAPAMDPGVDIALVEQRIDGLLAIGNGGDEFGDSLASIELWADALDAEFGDGWFGSDLTGGLGDLNLGGGAL